MTAEELSAEAARIQEVMAGLRPMGPSRRYAGGLRERIERYLDAGVAGGANRAELAMAAGVPVKTIDRWMRLRRRAAPGPGAQRAKLVPVTLATPRFHAGLAVVTPRGVRLEGLDVEAAVRVLRELG